MPGSRAATVTVAGRPGIPFAVTTTVAVPGAISNGTWKFAWSWPTKINGAGVPFTVTETSPKQPVPGVVVEMRLESPSGTFRWRYSRANPTIEGAIGAAVELPILIGKKINQEGGTTHAD